MPTRNYSYQEIRCAPKALRAEILLHARYCGQTPFASVLFIYSVLAYKRTPSKTKAIFIWNLFLRDMLNPSNEFNPFDMTPAEVTKPRLVAILTHIELAERQSAEAQKLPWAIRKVSALGRMMSPVLFDGAVSDFFDRDFGSSGNPMRELVATPQLTKPRSDTMDKVFVKHLPTLIAAFRNAGFLLDEVGLA